MDSLEDADGDALAALRTLNDHDRQVQNRGWSFNRYLGVTLTRATDGTIPAPDQCLRITRPYLETGGYSNDVILKGLKLWDRSRNSFLFDGSVTVDMIVRAPWDELPDAARRLITLSAAREFQANLQNAGGIVAQVRQADLTSALAILEQHEDEADPQNGITGNVAVQRKLFGDGVRRRNASGAPASPTSNTTDQNVGATPYDFVGLVDGIVGNN